MCVHSVNPRYSLIHSILHIPQFSFSSILFISFDQRLAAHPFFLFRLYFRHKSYYFVFRFRVERCFAVLYSVFFRCASAKLLLAFYNLSVASFRFLLFASCIFASLQSNCFIFSRCERRLWTISIFEKYLKSSKFVQCKNKIGGEEESMKENSEPFPIFICYKQ